MKNIPAPFIANAPATAYILPRSEHEAPTKAQIIRETQTTITVVTAHGERTFNRNKYGGVHSERGASSSYSARTLTLDVAGTEANEARRLALREIRNRADAAKRAIEKIISGKTNGYGHICDEDFAIKLEAALAILTA